MDTIALSFLRDKSHRTLPFAGSICPSNFTVRSRASTFQVSLSKENTEIKICLKSERFLITSGFHEVPLSKVMFTPYYIAFRADTKTYPV